MEKNNRCNEYCNNADWIDSEVLKLMDEVNFKGCNIGSVRETIKNIAINIIRLKERTDVGKNIDLEEMIIRLIRGLPVTELQGTEDEWVKCSVNLGVERNKRYSNVVRYNGKNIYAKDETARIFTYDGKNYFNDVDSSVDIDFPYNVPAEPDKVFLKELRYNPLFGANTIEGYGDNLIYHGKIDAESLFITSEELINAISDTLDKVNININRSDKVNNIAQWNVVSDNIKDVIYMIPDRPLINRLYIKDIMNLQDNLKYSDKEIMLTPKHKAYKITPLMNNYNDIGISEIGIDKLFFNYNNERNTNSKILVFRDDGDKFYIDVDRLNILNVNEDDKYDWLPVLKLEV